MKHDEQMVIAAKLGARIAELREAAGLTQAELGRRTGRDGSTPINRPNIARLEGGRYGSLPQTLTLIRIARALDLQPSAIYSVLDEAVSAVASETAEPADAPSTRLLR